MAPNGNLIALGCGTIVQVYKYLGSSVTLVGVVKIHETNSGGVVKYQTLNFSPDSRNLIVATQEDCGNQDAVYIRVWECDKDQLNVRFRPEGFKLTVVSPINLISRNSN
jgi:hypothetical protein